MFHGYGNLDKAINLLNENEKKDFEVYVNTKTSFSANVMYLSKNPAVIDKFYENLFTWLEKCEEIFALKETNVYGLRRMYTFLAERYASYWFEANCKVKYLSHARLGGVMLSNKINKFINPIKIPFTLRMYPTIHKY